MSSQGFSFPPPPPPPPRQQQPPAQQQQHNHAQPYGQSYRGQRGGRSAGGHPRGRGRGYGNRGGGGGGGGGGGRGGHYGALSPAYSANAAPPSVGYAPMNYTGFPTQPMSTTPTPGIAAPQYASNYPPTSTTFPSPQTFSQPAAAQVSPYQHQATSYDAYNQAMGQMAQAYASAMPSYQHTPPAMHWGYGQTGPTGSFPGAQQGNAWSPHSFNNNAYGNNTPNRDQPAKNLNKRDHSSAFGKPQSIAPRVPAPPPVPSFGNPLPSKPPPPSNATQKPKKKKRKHNQLGLTPKTEDHESSEEEDDADEESKLASGGGGAANVPLRFTYRGRTATLQTPEEIASWIEERKKRFPTQAKIEEKKKAMEEAKKAREEAMKQKKEARKQETKKPQKERQQQRASGNPVDAVAKATEKADKLRRKLEKEQKRVAKAEADAERARLKVEELRKESTGPNQDGAAAGHVSGELSEIANPVAVLATQEKPVDEMEATEVSSSFDTTDDSDWTSSSGSDVSSSDSEESDKDEDADSDDSAPEEITSRREGPEQVPPPPRTNVKRRVCRHFARKGKCLRGDKCNFLHELPERKAKAKPAAPQQQKGRKGLLQMLLDRQEEDDNHRIMEAIMTLGENGVLDEPAVPDSHGQPPVHVNGSATDVSDRNNASAAAAAAATAVNPGTQDQGSQEETMSATADTDLASAAATS